MAYSDDFTSASDAGLKNKIRMAACKAALDITGESGTKEQHAKRHALAALVLADGGVAQLDRIVFAAVTGGSLTAASTDAAIDSRIASIWDDLAGVRLQDI